MTTEDNRYGWIMVGVTFGLTAIAFGGLAGVSVFIKPLSAEFGWSRGAVSFGYTAIALSSAVAGLLRACSGAPPPTGMVPVRWR